MRPDRLWRRYDRLLGSNSASDLKDELHFHLEAKVDDLVAQGWELEAAIAWPRGWYSHGPGSHAFYVDAAFRNCSNGSADVCRCRSSPVIRDAGRSVSFGASGNARRPNGRVAL